MIRKIKFGSKVIPYTVIQTNRIKTSQITVDKNNVIVRTPSSKTLKEIKYLVESKSKWIFTKQQELKKRKNVVYKTETIKKANYLEKRAQKLASKIGIKPSKIVVKPLKNRWGSATEKGVVTLNSHLLKAPKDVIDYIIIHELCHLKIKNHSFRFWNLVRKFMPNYEEKKEWLEKNTKSIIHPHEL